MTANPWVSQRQELDAIWNLHVRTTADCLKLVRGFTTTNRENNSSHYESGFRSRLIKAALGGFGEAALSEVLEEVRFRFYTSLLADAALNSCGIQLSRDSAKCIDFSLDQIANYLNASARRADRVESVIYDLSRWTVTQNNDNIYPFHIQYLAYRVVKEFRSPDLRDSRQRRDAEKKENMKIREIGEFLDRQRGGEPSYVNSLEQRQMRSWIQREATDLLLTLLSREPLR